MKQPAEVPLFGDAKKFRVRCAVYGSYCFSTVRGACQCVPLYDPDSASFQHFGKRLVYVGITTNPRKRFSEHNRFTEASIFDAVHGYPAPLRSRIFAKYGHDFFGDDVPLSADRNQMLDADRVSQTETCWCLYEIDLGYRQTRCSQIDATTRNEAETIERDIISYYELERNVICLNRLIPATATKQFNELEAIREGNALRRKRQSLRRR